MKRVLFLFLTILMAVILAGCDWLSTATIPSDLTSTTTTITESTDTTTTGVTDTTTTGVTDTTESTETTDTTVSNQYTVTFYDVDTVTVLGYDLVNPGEDATPPADPTKTSTAQYTFTFAGWSPSYENVNANLSVYATYTAALRQYTVSFFDDSGVVLLKEQTVNYGTDATPPASPTKATTVQYTYAFAGWDGSYTNVMTNRTILATFTATLRQYTVTFYNADGALIGTSTVDYDTPAIAPTPDPTLASTAQYRYAFSGWDAELDHIQGNMDAHAEYDQILQEYEVVFVDDDGSTVLGSDIVPYGSGAEAPGNPEKTGYSFQGWDRDFSNVMGEMTVIATYRYDLLESLVLLTFGEYVPSEEEIEERILFIKQLLGTETDEATAALLGAALTIKDSFAYGTLTDFLGWYEGMETLGYDKEQIVDMAINAILMGLDEKIGNYDPTYLEGDIANAQADIDAAMLELGSMITTMHEYCTISTDPGYQSQCHLYVEQLLADFQMGEDYNQLYNHYAYDLYENSWDYKVINELEYTIDWYLHYVYVTPDPELAAYYLGQYDSVIAMMTPDEQTMYVPIAEAYMALGTNYHTTVMASETLMFGWLDLYGNPVADTLKNNYFWAYRNSYWYMNYLYDQLDNLTEEQHQVQAQHEIMLSVRAYLANPENLGKVKILAETIYDVLDSVILGVDEATYDLIIGLITGTIDPTTLEMTPEDIDGYLAMVANLLTLISSSIDQADYDNFTALAKDLVEIYIDSTDMTELEKAAFLLSLQGAVDQYTLAIGDTYMEVIDLLNSMTPEKIQIIMDQIAALTQQEVSTSPYDMVVSIALLVDTIAGEGEFDILGIADHFLDGYFDFKFMFKFDPDQKILTKALILEELATLLELADVIKDYDTSLLLDATQLQNLTDFMSGIQWLMEGFQWGLEYLPDMDVPGYTHDQFLTLIYNLYGWDISTELADQIIVDFSEAFLMDEESTYYQLIVVSQLLPELEGISTYEEFQAWYGQLALLGYDHDTIVNFGTAYLISMIDYKADNPYLLEQITYYQEMIEGVLLGIAIDEADIAEIDASIRAEILLNSPNPTCANLYVALWEALLAEIPLSLTMNQAYNEVRYSDEYSWMWDGLTEWNYETLLVYLENIYYFNTTLGFDEVARNQNQVWYDSLWASFSPEQQAMFSLILDDVNALYGYRYGPLMAYYEAVYSLGYTVYDSYGTDLVLTLEYAKFDTYYDEMWILQQTYDIDNWTQCLAGYENEHQQILAWQAFFADPANVQLVKNVVSIVLDEFENLLASADPDTINLLIGLMNGSIDPSTLAMDAAALEGYAHEASALLGLLFSTVDEAEADQIILLIQTVLAVQINLRSDLTELQKADLILLYSGAIEEYYAIGMDALSIVTTFLDNLTAAEIQIIMDNIEVINALGEAEDDLSNWIRAVAMAQIIGAVAGDGFLDTDAIIALAIGGYFDFKYEFTYGDTAYITAKILEIQVLIDDIIAQADVIDGYDPNNLQAGELEQINAFHLLIEEFMVLAQNGPEPIV